MKPDEERVVSAPRDESYARERAEAWGLPVQVTDLCPPGRIYVLNPAKLFDPDDERWPYTVRRIDLGE